MPIVVTGKFYHHLYNIFISRLQEKQARCQDFLIAWLASNVIHMLLLSEGNISVTENSSELIVIYERR